MVRSLTIVVASYQREQHLRALLQSVKEALDELDSTGIEVLVVLDGSTDGSASMLEAQTTGFPVPLRHVWQENHGLASARNTGIARAETELVWLLDDDMVVSRVALRRHHEHPRDVAAILMGPCEVRSDDPDITHSSWWYAERHRRLAQEGFVRAPHDSSFANTSAPTELLQRHRFDERFRGYGIEDFELAVRLFAAGETIAFDRDAAITHHFSPTRAESLRKLREEGANRMRFIAMHPSLEHVVFRADPGRVERVVARLSRLPTGRGLWGLARFIDRIAASRPIRRFRPRLLVYADLAAIYSGVSAYRRADRS